jgi:hypothetical protein
MFLVVPGPVAERDAPTAPVPYWPVIRVDFSRGPTAVPSAIRRHEVITTRSVRVFANRPMREDAGGRR